jgi:hypothetical protein
MGSGLAIVRNNKFLNMSSLKTAVGLIQANPQCYKPGNINEYYFDNNFIDNTGND